MSRKEKNATTILVQVERAPVVAAVDLIPTSPMVVILDSSKMSATNSNSIRYSSNSHTNPNNNSTSNHPSSSSNNNNHHAA